VAPKTEKLATGRESLSLTRFNSVDRGRLPRPGEEVPAASRCGSLGSCVISAGHRWDVRSAAHGTFVAFLDPFGEVLGQAPDLAALAAADRSAATGPPGPEVIGAGVDGLADNDVSSFVGEELGVPAGFPEFDEKVAPKSPGRRVGDQLPAAGRFGFGPGGDVRGELVNVDDVDLRQQVGTAQSQRPGPEVCREVLGEHGEQDLLALVRLDRRRKVIHPVQRDDRLPGAGPSADPRRAEVAPFDDLPCVGCRKCFHSENEPSRTSSSATSSVVTGVASRAAAACRFWGSTGSSTVTGLVTCSRTSS